MLGLQSVCPMVWRCTAHSSGGVPCSCLVHQHCWCCSLAPVSCHAAQLEPDAVSMQGANDLHLWRERLAGPQGRAGGVRLNWQAARQAESCGSDGTVPRKHCICAQFLADFTRPELANYVQVDLVPGAGCVLDFPVSSCLLLHALTAIPCRHYPYLESPAVFIRQFREQLREFMYRTDPQ